MRAFPATQVAGRYARPFKIVNGLRKIAKTWSNFLAFTILKGNALYAIESGKYDHIHLNYPNGDKGEFYTA